jgi:hypothetical protein
VRYSGSIAIAAYVLAGLMWTAWTLDQQVFFGQPAGDIAALAAFGLVHLFVGWATLSWWALFLPFALVAFALPLGYPDPNHGEPFPVWFGVLFSTPAFLALLAVGGASHRTWLRKQARVE